MYAFVIIAFLFLPTVSWGVPLPPGALIPPLESTSLAERPDLAGTIIAETTRQLDLRFRTSPTDISTTPLEVRDWVVQTGAGTLDFYRQVTCCPATTNVEFGVLNFSSFAGFTTDVDFRTDLTGKPPPFGLVARHSSASTDFPDRVSFIYAAGGGIGQGVRLDEDNLPFQPIFVKTDATAFNEGGVLSLDPVGPTGLPLVGENVFPGFYQPSIVPEPSTGFLLISGLAAIALARFWKTVVPSRSR